MKPVFISHKYPNYPLVFDEILSNYNSNELILLCGAGISFDKPSCLPGGIKLKGGLVGSMINSLISLKIDVDFDYVKEKLIALPLELLLDALVTAFGRDDALKYLDVLDLFEYNLNHYYIANLAYYNDSFKIITLNFDILIEYVLDTLDVNYNVSCPLSGNQNRESNNKFSKIEVIKPHGSFNLPNEKGDRLKNITTTVSEIRDKPDDRTIKVLRRILKKSPNILVAGYNGEDWDILPIIYILSEEISDLHIYWVQHQKQDDINKYVKGEKRSFKKPVPQVSDLLDRVGDRAHLLYGDVNKLLEELVKRTRININSEIINNIKNSEMRDRKLDVSLFIQNKCASTLAIASLLQESERGITKKILDVLKNSSEIIKNPFFHQAYCNISAWWHYIGKSYDEGIRLRKKAILINKNILKKKSHEIAGDIISTGYQYISYAKPQLFNILEFIKTPFYFIKGRYYLFIGEKMADNISLKAFARYYKADFLHNWVSILLLFNNRLLNFLRKLFFKRIDYLYDKISKKYPSHMDREYFYMRKIEAEVLSGSKPIKLDVEKKLVEIERYFRLTSQLDHLRNVCITKAFLSYSEDPYSDDIIKYVRIAQLDKQNIEDYRLENDDHSYGIANNSCAKAIFDIVKKSSEKRTITKSAIRRYKIFERFFYPEKISLKEVVDSIR